MGLARRTIRRDAVRMEEKDWDKEFKQLAQLTHESLKHLEHERYLLEARVTALEAALKNAQRKSAQAAGIITLDNN